MAALPKTGTFLSSGRAMTAAQRLVYLGTDGGATTSKTGAVWADGTTVSTKLLQRPTGSAGGPQTVVQAWVDAIADYLAANGLSWDAGRRRRPRDSRSVSTLRRVRQVTQPPCELRRVRRPRSVQRARSPTRAGRAVPLIVGNDGNMGGVAEAQRVRGHGDGDAC